MGDYPVPCVHEYSEKDTVKPRTCISCGALENEPEQVLPPVIDAEELARFALRLILVVKDSSGSGKEETSAFAFVKDLKAKGLIRGLGDHSTGDYFIRMIPRDAAIFTFGGQEIAFSSLQFARACKSAYVQTIHKVPLRILQVIE